MQCGIWLQVQGRLTFGFHAGPWLNSCYPWQCGCNWGNTPNPFIKECSLYASLLQSIPNTVRTLVSFSARTTCDVSCQERLAECLKCLSHRAACTRCGPQQLRLLQCNPASHQCNRRPEPGTGQPAAEPDPELPAEPGGHHHHSQHCQPKCGPRHLQQCWAASPPNHCETLSLFLRAP